MFYHIAFGNAIACIKLILVCLFGIQGDVVIPSLESHNVRQLYPKGPNIGALVLEK
jgi:hypothetical protein